jgi:hypothetical protein
MSIMKVLFLDIDGVLNRIGTKERHRGFIGIDLELVPLFERIIESTGVKVVLSSTWRLSETWREDLERCGLNTDAMIDRTPHMPIPGGLESCERGKEIAAWLAEHPEVNHYAILDDHDDMLPGQPLFQTSWLTGLTEEVADKVINHLIQSRPCGA